MERKIYFTADHHWGHNNIIKLQDRPFTSIDEMNECMINAWNEAVDVLDEVYHLGDIFFKTNKRFMEETLIRLNGQKYLIKGNHDKQIEKPWFEKYFNWIKDYHEITYQDRLIVLCHYPFESWKNSYHGAWHLHGHCHGNLQKKKNRLDVGVDSVGIIPIEITQIKGLIEWESEQKI